MQAEMDVDEDNEDDDGTAFCLLEEGRPLLQSHGHPRHGA